MKQTFEKASSLTKFSVAWIIMFALMHIIAVFSAPWLAADTPEIELAVVYIPLGASLIAGVLLVFQECPRRVLLGQIFLMFNALLQIWGCINSFTGQAPLNIPGPYVRLFELALAALEGLSSVFIIHLVVESESFTVSS